MEESGSPRFRKLHFPVGLWINSPRKHFAKLGARWPSAASVKSTTSSDAASVHEAPPPAPASSLSFSSPSLAPPSPSPAPTFLRPRPANQPQSRAKRLSHLFLRGRSNSDRDRAIGEREREFWARSATPSSHHVVPPASSSAPGLVKIYGDALSSGANYRSLLANIHSTAQQLIQQVITRYTEREREIESDDIVLQKHSPEDFLLCDVIGKPIQQADGGVQWQTECRRGVAPWECPLLLVDMWRPKDGFERRFEIQRRDEYEREEREKERERERDGENFQVRWRRNRMASGSGPEEERGHRGRNTELRRSISDMNLSLRRRQGNQATNDPRRGGNTPTNGGPQDRKNIVSMIATEAEEVTGSRVLGDPDRHSRAADEERETCDLEVMSQSLILPPTDRPYFLFVTLWFALSFFRTLFCTSWRATRMFLGESQRSARGKRTGREKGRGRGLSEWTLSFQLQTYSHDTFWSGGTPLSLTNPVDKGRVGESQNRVGESQSRVGESLGRVGVNQSRVGESLNRVGESQSRVGENLSRVGESLNRVGESQNRVGESLGRVGESRGRVGESRGRVGESQGRVGVNQSRVGESQSRVGENLSRVGESLNRVGESQSRVGESLNRVGESRGRVGESQGRVALLRPFRGGAVTHNGVVLYRETVLKPGDLIGLGSHFLFLYRDPRVTPAPPLALAPPWQALLDSTTSLGAGNMVDRQEALRQYLGSTEAVLKFQAKHADAVLQEIMSKNSTPDSGGGPLAPAYLLSLMIDYASKHLDPALTPQLLLKAANQIKAIVWDNIKEFGDKHPTQTSSDSEADLPPPSVQKLSSDLRPLMFWMSNATELLNFFQVKVEAMEKEWEFEAPGDPVLSADMDTCSEALAQLDDVIMHTFQQCVYHLTKTLYSLLPTLLDTNPFSSEEKEKEKVGARDGANAGGEEGHEEGDVSSLPPTVAGLVEVYRCSLELSREACLSPPLTSQTFGYLFFFTNTSLLNTLLERDGLFSWSRAVQIRTNLDLVLDWLQGAGLGDIASEFLKKLSVTVNFLCIPKTRLIQSSWTSLQEDHALLSPAQLHHLLTHYKLGPSRAPPSCWAPPPGTELGGDIFESFLDHPPLILPNEAPSLDLTQQVPTPELQKEVTRLRTFLWGLDQDELPANQRTRL
ncbi:hypothetical protein NFI96_021997 [Prochilodus magdalenae]|nr:hypothetical protein NFI96_021997 [Prochilodus magdalenae]